MQVKPWRIEWTPEQITNFWDWHASHPQSQALYFSRLAGDAVLDAASKHVRLRGTAIDVGAGPGYLTEKLLARGMQTLAADTSAESIAKLAARLQSRKNFLGAAPSALDRLPFPDAVGDLAFVIETVEHLDDAALRSLLQETHRVLKPRGFVVVTTPNEEDLRAAELFCPNCGCVFHQWQHLRAWSAQSLTTTMQEHGFERIKCYATLFMDEPLWFKTAYRIAFKLRRKKFPHLFYLGEKR